MQQTTAYRNAKRQVQRKIGFYFHLVVFLSINTGLALFHLLQTTGDSWTFRPFLGWGIGLLFHGFAVFLHAPGAAWKQRMIESELKKTGR